MFTKDDIVGTMAFECLGIVFRLCNVNDFGYFRHRRLCGCFRTFLEKSGGQALPRHIIYMVELEYFEEPQVGLPVLTIPADWVGVYARQTSRLKNCGGCTWVAGEALPGSWLKHASPSP